MIVQDDNRISIVVGQRAITSTPINKREDLLFFIECIEKDANYIVKSYMQAYETLNSYLRNGKRMIVFDSSDLLTKLAETRPTVYNFQHDYDPKD